MTGNEWLAQRFEEQRPHLRAVAYRMLGSLAEADDAVQDAWLRASGSDAAQVANLRGWLTTIVARVALNMLRARRTHREDPIQGRLPDPVVSVEGSSPPEDEAMLADSVGLALLVVLDTLEPAERLAFVLHDVFKLPFSEIAPMVERTPAAARQLASRARRRVRGARAAAPDADLYRQREVVDAFFAATRAGDFGRLVTLLDPAVVLRADFGRRRAALPAVVRGTEAVIELAMTGARLPGAELVPVLINGVAGVVVTLGGRPFSLMAFVVKAGRIVEIDAIGDAKRVARLAASVLA
ncbi:MAG TPA: sigma-70 family RNA polymerase sigma factor [Candidatus Dormibacteraeota bacterium]|nr:sigma-70 family RNA polymerase sigma factor [Candidatus Dormibacteraeota bacterium]